MATFAIELQRHAEAAGGDASVRVSYVVADSTAGTSLMAHTPPITLAVASPGTWRDTIVQAIIDACAANGYTVPAANVRLLKVEPGDRRGEIVAAWTKDAIKTNIGTAYVNVYTGLAGELQGVDFLGKKEYRLVIHVNKVGTGTQTAGLMDQANSANLMILDDTGAAGENMLDSGWPTLPSWANGEINLKPVAKSTVAADDPVYRQFILYLR